MSRLPWLVAALMPACAALAAEPQRGGATAAAVTVDAAAGSTIVGEQDSAMGLYLLPWKDEYASGLEQPPALLDVPPAAIDGDRLQRDTEYRESAASYRRSRSQRNP